MKKNILPIINKKSSFKIEYLRKKFKILNGKFGTPSRESLNVLLSMVVVCFLMESLFFTLFLQHLV